MNIKKRFLSLLVFILIMIFFVGYAYAAPIITIETDKTSYYLGEEMMFSGTNTVSDTVSIFIKGANLAETYITNTTINTDGTWEITFDPTIYCQLNLGTFTFYATSNVDILGDVKTFKKDYPYNAVSVALRKPFISVSEGSLIVAPGDPLVISGTAELPKENSGVLYYIFGKNYFYTNSASVTGTSYGLNIDTTSLVNGQYFVVVQHPMCDRVFNIGPIMRESGYDIVENSSGQFNGDYACFLFNTEVRQNANAAEALCQALDTQNIDDTYVRVSFIVDSTQGKLISISDVSRSSSYPDGDSFTISGVNTDSTCVHLYLEYPSGTRKLLSNEPIYASTDKTWTTSVSHVKTPEAGTYTIYAVAGDLTPPDPSTITGHLYATWTIDVFLTVDEISPVLTMGTPQFITGNATGTTHLLYYIFGTNYFATNTISVNEDDSYSLFFNTESKSSGQYFLVIQHSGSDGVFNVGPVVSSNGGFNIVMNTSGSFNGGDSNIQLNNILFNTLERQSKNAAEALCQVLDSQNIDDECFCIPLIVDQTEGSLFSIRSSYWEPSFTDGDTLTLSGVNTNSSYVHLYFEYPNGTRQLLSNLPITVSNDKDWTTKVSYPKTSLLGTYIIYAVAGGLTPPDPSTITDYLYDTYTRNICLNVDEMSPVIAKGTSEVITGNATGTTQLLYYIFGTNYFVTDTISVDGDGSYWIYINTESKSSGQYFVVIQHPGRDGVFNIGPVAAESGGYDIMMNTSGSFTSGQSTYLFNTLVRQSANAAEALCQALDSQNIDDIYVKLTFIVAQPALSINTVSDVVKGQPLKVSGTTNFKEGTVVTVDVLSPVVNSAHFVTMTTKVVKGVDGDNTWKVIIDTTELNANIYRIQVLAGGEFVSSMAQILPIPGETPVQRLELCQGVVLESITVSPVYSRSVTEDTPVSISAIMYLEPDAISSRGSLRLTTDLITSTVWTVDVYEGIVTNTQASKDSLITSFASSGYIYTLSGFVLDYDHPVTLFINLTGKFSPSTSNITAITIDFHAGSGGSYGSYSYIYGPANPSATPDNEIELQPGWNFISVPKALNQTINTAGTLFGSVDTDDKNILGYNAQTHTWIPLGAADIIQPLNGYWIYAATGTTISLTYPSAPTSPSVKTLSPGWNAVGLSAGESTSAKTALAGTSWRTLIPWNLAAAKYDTAIVNGGSEPNNPSRLMTLGNGYWLYVDAESTLIGLTA